MIRRIELVNFMSHPHTVIEPARGLTVLTGGNNTGKSALIAALQTLCRNVSGDYMVRHGQRDCRIVVETEEGHVLEWKRIKGTVSYTVNGRDVHRLRGTVPEDLHELLRMPLVEAEGDPFDVHFGEQKKPIFLLDESPGRRATFFASSSDAIRLIEMQNRHRTRVRDARNEENRLTVEAARLETRLDALTPLDKIENRLCRIESEYEAIAKAEQKSRELTQHLAALRQMQHNEHQYAEMADTAESLSPPPELADTGALERVLRQMAWQQRRIDAEAEAKTAVSDLAALPEMADTDRLAALIARIDRAAAELESQSARQDVMAECPEPPETVDTRGLSRHIESMEHAHKSLQVRAAELETAEKQLADAEHALRRMISSRKICPTCGQTMDPDRFLHHFYEAREPAEK